MVGKIFKALLLLFLLLLMPAVLWAGIGHFTGNWKNIDSGTRGVTKLKIAAQGHQVYVQAWGKCHPQDCAWGRVKAEPYASSVSSDMHHDARVLLATFNTTSSVKRMLIKPTGQRLRIEVLTRFKSGSGRSDYYQVYTLAKYSGDQQSGQQGSSFSEDCISFDPDRIRVRRINGRWKIVEGNHWMFDFGDKRDEAMQAYKTIKHYRMSQSCFVGRPNPSFSYLLVSGRAPANSMAGEDCLPFNPNKIQVKYIQGRWKIVEGSHWIFDFNKNKSEAIKAWRIIKKYGFSRSCYVGRPNPSFRYLRK